MQKQILSLSVFVMLLASFVIAGDALIPLRTDAPPVIDGKLDDPVWQQAPSVTGFKTFFPDFGKDMPDPTVVYFAYDRENLYFAFRCFDREPAKIKTSVTRRDNVRPDDWICINLDSFNDQQSLYGFYVNPAGIQGDTRFASGREDDGLDLIWYSAGSIDDKGYTIEVRIPFKSIRFANKATVEMGVVFERRVSRRAEQGTYPALKPQRGMFFLTQTMPMHLRDIKHYKLFELLPAVTAGERSSRVAGKMVSEGQNTDLSLTTKYGLTSDFIFDGTYNPDFSQVESDAGQVDVNLRSALFFSEKRPFFLEGNENFNFAGGSSNDPLGAIVHTRTIVDPIAGLKLSGKLGKKNFLAAIDALDELPGGDPQGKRAHSSILRYKQFFFRLSYRRGKAIRFAADPFQGRGSSASANVIYQPSDKLNANLTLTYSDLFRDTNSEKIFAVTILRSRLTYQLNRYLFLRAIAEHNDFRKRLLTDFLASFTYIPGTVLHFGYGSIYEKNILPNDAGFTETKRGFFAKASYLWRL